MAGSSPALSEPLTQPEVDALPSGTRVIVTWSGGNGPHEYDTRRHFDLVVAVYKGTDVGFLSRVGKRPLTEVRLASHRVGGDSDV